MATTTSRIDRLAALVTLVREAHSGSFGRTALMKCSYFLQVLKDVNLGYRFSLYTYGPYDSNVLDDLEYAQSLGALDVTMVSYPTGYGYSIREGEQSGQLLDQAEAFLSGHGEAIKEVAEVFGNRTASHLELQSAIVFVDRTLLAEKKTCSIDEIIGQVEAIKPRFSREAIGEAAEELRDRGFLSSPAA